MLIELDKLLSKLPTGICLIDYGPTLSPTFIFMHFLNNFIKQTGRVIFLSLHTSAELFRISNNKMAQRFDDQACQFVAMKEFFNGDSLVPETNELMQQIFEAIQKRIQPNKPHLIILDDLFLLAIKNFKPSKLFQFLLRIRTELPDDSLILVSIGNAAGNLRNYTDSFFDLQIQLTPIGAGFGKNITGKMEIIQRDKLIDTRPRTTTLHYFCGQRSVKTFVPGSVQLFI